MADVTSIIKCEHCGNRTPMVALATPTATVPLAPPEYGDTIHLEWALYMCPVCSNPILRESDSESFDYDGTPEWRTLYPEQIKLRNELPTSVRKAYEAALRVRHVEPNAFAVLIGRTLEFTCQDRGANGRTLHEMLNDLSNRDIIPALLVEVAHQMKAIRNFGAHADVREVDSADIPLLIELTESLFDHLYGVPARLDALKRSIERRKQKRDTDSCGDEW